MKTKEIVDALCTLGRKKTDPMLAMGSLLYYGAILLNRYSIRKEIDSLPDRIQFYSMLFAPSGTGKSWIGGKVQEICSLETYPEQMRIMYNHFISLEPDTVADEDIEKFIPASPTVAMTGSKEGLYQICRAVKDSGFGSVNLQVDEFADSISNSHELINKLKELYDGKYQAKVIKGVKGESVESDINDITVNMMAMGSLDGLDANARKILNTLAKSGMYRRSLVINSTEEIQQNDLDNADLTKIQYHFKKLDKKWKNSYKKRLESYPQIGTIYKLFSITQQAKDYIEKIDSMLLQRHKDDKLNLFKSYDVGSLNLIVNIGFIFAFLEGRDTVDIENLKSAWSLFVKTRDNTYEIFKDKQPHIEIYELLKIKANLTQSELLSFDRSDCIPESKNKFKDAMLLVQELAYKRGEELYIGSGVVVRYSIRELPLTNLDKLIFSIERDGKIEKSIMYEAVELGWSSIETGKLPKSSRREIIDDETGELEIIGIESFTIAHYEPTQRTDPYGHRRKDSFIQGQNVIGFDIDDGMKIEEMKIILEPYTYCIYTTKSHHKAKRNYGDSFRVLMPTKNMFYVNPEQHKQMYKNIVDFLKISPDIACYNVSRLYFTNASAEVIVNEASLFDTSPFMPDTDMNEKILPLLMKNRIGVNSIKSESEKENEIDRRIDGMVNHAIIYIQKGTLRDQLFKLWKFIVDITNGDKNRAEKEIRFVKSAKGFPEKFIQEILSNHG